MLTRAEKEKLVKERYEEGSSIRDIAKEVHLSFGTISSIIKKHAGEVEVGIEQEATIDTKVFKLLQEGKTSVEVAIALNIGSEQVTRLYADYWKLKGLCDLNQLYEERKNDLAEFHAAYKIMKEEGATPRQLVDAAHSLQQLALLEPRLKNINHDIQSKENQKQAQLNELSLLRNDITLALQEVDSYTSIISTNKEQIARLSHQVQELKSLIARLKNTGEYRRIEKVAEAMAKKIFRDNKMILEIALGAVIQTLKNDPDLQLVISGPPRYSTYGAGSSIQNFLILYNTKILKMSGQVFNDLLEKCVNNTMSSALNMPTGAVYPR